MAETRRAEFVDFYRGTYARIVGEVCLLASSRAEAEDLAQEAFCRAWARWPRIATYDDPAGWVRRVAYNLAVSRWRSARRFTVLLPRLAGRDVADTEGEDWLDLRERLRRLPPRVRQALVWSAVVGLSTEEVAREMNVPAATVRSWLHRARNTVGQELATEGAREERPR